MKNNKKTDEIHRVFISSTFEDMQEYRNAARDALTSIEHLPIGMEHFVAETQSSLDVCLANVRRCDLLILLIGMRYGSIDKNMGKSFTELEYEEAKRNNTPILVFIINEQKCPVLPIYIDTDEKAVKLKNFKENLKSQDAEYAIRFDSTDDLKIKIVQSVKKHFENSNNKGLSKSKPIDDNVLLEGAKKYRKFILCSERSKNEEVYLRIRMDGLFANNHVRRDELYDAYGLNKGDTVVAENVIPINIDMTDIGNGGGYVDLYAEGKNADWIIDNDITTGIIFDGKFRMAYELVEGVVQNKAHAEPTSAKIPALILLEGIQVIGMSEDTKFQVRHKSQIGKLALLNDILNDE